MEQVLDVYHRKIFNDINAYRVEDLKAYAEKNGLKALSVALAQRYKL